MARLQTLKPRLQTLSTQRAPTLTTQEAGARPTGDGWQKTRRRIALKHGYMCAKCGLLWNLHRDEVDHRIPRWAGGSDGDENLWLLHAEPCHAEKTAEEAPMRATGVYVMPAWIAALMPK